MRELDQHVLADLVEKRQAVQILIFMERPGRSARRRSLLLDQ